MDKLIRSVNALKFHYGGLVAEEKNQRDTAFNPKERQTHINSIAESLCSSSLKTSSDLPGLLTISIEILLQACTDESADVRINADESLNKIIKCLHETAIGKILVELYKDIKKNGHSRSLRASLSRFASLCFNIRPSKCRAYILNLLPCLCRISQREEDYLQECLATSTCKIFSVLGAFVSEGEVQGLIASFLKNLSSKSLSIRRSASTCLHAIIVNSRKRDPVLLPLLHSILDILIQRHTDRSTVLGCMQTLRLIVPLLQVETKPSSSSRSEHQALLTQIFESSIYYICHKDHTVVTSALELLEQLFKSFSLQFATVLSTLFVAQSFVPSDVPPTQDDSVSMATSSSSASLSNLAAEEDQLLRDNLASTVVSGGEDLNLHINGEQPTQEADDHQSDVQTSIETSENKSLLDPAPIVTESADNSSITEVSEVANTADQEEDSTLAVQFSDFFASSATKNKDVPEIEPLYLLGLMLCQRFLLTKQNGELLQNRKVRVSMKNLALTCLSHLVNISPAILCLQLYTNVIEETDCTARPTMMKDVFSYCNHDDPQLRGAVLSVASMFISSVVMKHRSGLVSWVEVESNDHRFVTLSSAPDINKLVTMMITALSDESSGTVRQACSAIASCLETVLNSVYFQLGFEMVNGVFSLQHNTYWLLQTDLLEIIATLNFRQLTHIENQLKKSQTPAMLLKNLSIQDKALSIALQCLESDDSRIRKVAGETLVSMVTNLSLLGDDVSTDAFVLCRKQLGLLYLGSNTNEVPEAEVDIGSVQNMLKTYRGYKSASPEENVTESLMLIVQSITSILSTSTKKHSSFGCIAALKLLTMKFSVCQYPEAWGCHFTKALDNDIRLRSGSNVSSNDTTDSDVQLQQLGILPLVMDLLKTNWLPLDITAHSDCLILAGNLIAGAATHEYRVLGETNSEAASPTDSRRSSSLSSVPSHNLAWSSIQDSKLSSYAQSLFVHLVKLLSINHHVITETTPSSNKSVLPNLPSNPSLPSPIKRKEKAIKDQTGGNQSKISPKPARKILPSSPLSSETNKGIVDGDKEKNTKKTLGNFYQNRVLMKLYEQLNGAYKNYKSSLEFGRADRMVMFVDSVLDVTCQILELASFQDVANCTEEILSYLKSNFTLQANTAVLCTQQLLKALFGTNLVSHRASSDENANGGKSTLTSPRSNSTTDYKSSFYHQVFHHPLNHLTMSVANASFHNSLNSDSTSKDGEGWFGSIKKKMEIKLSRASKLAKSNKSSIQNYIRLFEGLVIRSLTRYTVTSSVDFQKEVLCLLAQLVQLRVNYCMLDSDLVFITFIIKQFESIETAMIRDSEGLVPHVFFFLVLLSYECYQSKSVITMPKIIQLCDGLMASGLGAISHVIPALQPIVHDLFVVKSQSRQDMKEMTTQREVVQFTMIKLIQHPQVFGMLTAVLQHGRRENPKSWKELSRQVTNVLLPHLNNLQIEINSQADVSSLHSLFEAISPTSLRPCDVIVECLFSVPPDVNNTSNVKRWVGKILVLLRLLICHVGEEDLMKSIKSLDKQLSTTKSASEDVVEEKSENREMFAAKFFHNVLEVSSKYLHHCSISSIHFDRDSNVFICQEIAELLLSLTYIHRSGSFKRFTAACRQLAAGTGDVTSPSSVETLHVTFATLSADFPVLTLLWCQYLTHLDAVQLKSWQRFVDSATDDKHVISREIVRRGSLILLADYVCQNMQQTDLMAWLVDNHTCDVIELHSEPPVQDLVTSVHRSSLAAKFIQSVAEIPKSDSQPTVLRNILRSLAGSTVTCTGELLEVLLGNQFLFSPFLVISQSCDRIACEHVEKVLAHGNNDGQVLSLEKIDELLSRLTSDEFRRRRFGRLYNLLLKSRDQLTGESTRHPSSSPTVETLLTDPGKDWFIQFLIGCCQRDTWTPECARALSNCDYDDIAQVMRNEHFKLRYLTPCLSFGVRESLNLSSGAAPYPDDQSSPIMKCASDVLANHVEEVAQYIDPLTDFREPLKEEYLNEDWTDKVFALCTNLTLQLKYNKLLPSECQLQPTLFKSCEKISMQAFQILYWQLHSGTSPSLSDVIACVETLQQLLKHDGVRQSILEHLPSVICVTQTLFHVVQHYIGELPLHKPFLPQSTSKQQAHEILSDAGNPLSACVRLSQLVDFFRNLTDAPVSSVSLPGEFARPIKNLVLHLSTSQHTNSYVRVPRLLWKFGWQPAITGEHGTTFPDLPSEYLQEKDVLEDFVGIINSIGWIRRTQYEETWASLLGVLVSQPVVVDSEAEVQNEDAIELSCIAIRALTSLVINCSLLPHGGQTATGSFEVLHRHTPLKIAHTRPGRQLLRVRSILNEEINALLAQRNHMDTHHHYNFCSRDPATADWLEQNMERVLTSNTEYGVGQVSIRAFQQVYGIHPAMDDVTSFDSSDDDSSAVTSSGPDQSLVDGDESDASDVFEQQQRSESTGAVALSPLRVRDGVDVHSCVQFLLDLFTEWFRTAAQANQTQPGSGQAPPSPIARPILCESVRALLLISDLFTERQQFEWMYSALIQLHSVQPPEDEILLQYIVTSICKAGSVLGLSMDVSEVVVRALEPCFSCPSVSWHISALQGALYCLERSPNGNLQPIVDLLAEFIPAKLVNATTSKSIYNEEYVIMLASVAFYVIEKCSEMIPPQFISVIVQASTLLLSTPETTSSTTSSRVYHAVTHGLERLVLAFALSSLECDVVLKTAAEQFQNNTELARSSAACGLMLTCMYCERMRTSPAEGGSVAPEQEDAVEIRLLAMERVSLLFERVRRGFSRDARVMTRILPLLLDDFFPPQDVMNKVIAEFISTFQPFPDLIAEVVNQVFQALHNRDQSQLVQEWVMLSLGNVIQRTPLSTAVWCLTCLFACASTNPWINSLLPVISVRRNRVEPEKDWDFFCKTALDFYRFQLSEELDRRSFHATFSTAASSHTGDSPYKLLLDCIGRLSGDSGILQ